MLGGDNGSNGLLGAMLNHLGIGGCFRMSINDEQTEVTVRRVSSHVVTERVFTAFRNLSLPTFVFQCQTNYMTFQFNFDIDEDKDAVGITEMLHDTSINVDEVEELPCIEIACEELVSKCEMKGGLYADA